MKKKFLATTMAIALSLVTLIGCGQKAEEPAAEEPAQEASVEEAATEASSEEAAAETSVETIEPARPTSLDDAIGLAVLEFNEERYGAEGTGEASGEGHILMDKDGDDASGEQVCYCLAMFGKYEFQDGNFVKCAGSGVIPTVITLDINEEGEYNLVSYKEAEDGNDFVDSIKENFPEKLWSRCITVEDDDANELERQERAYAEEYLSQIGREDAEIGSYADYEHPIATDLGISEEVSNKLIDIVSGDTFEKNCPYWFGEREVLEDNVRYIYKVEYDEKAKEITYSKTDYETGEVIESSVYDATTGEKVEK